ncbi:Inner membrane protein yhjX [uncultured Roseburia sp.]|uniref:MFS transporter n=1 Tax=Brotonthovivens ammoniilytica TaxID=2981725 RepID=A0ABT2TMF4_9FIRM|nr:MFS transporter [Brotonthovivens ammoniilytica]MCU6763400.1 MFS transporter [Brotonthovivens ammoniilytica]SCJ17923.1 Inner membrane protein yhjX [uncultured Roseburia sp.]
MNQNKVSYNFGKKGWGIIGYEVILLFFMTGMTVDGLNIIVPNMAAFKGWDADLLLSISTPAQIIALFLVVFWGGLIKKFGLKRVTVITMFLAAASTILYGNSMSVAMYAVMLVLMVVFINAFALNCGFAICANWFPTQKGIVMGFVTIGMNLASAIINLILNALTQRLNISWAISIMGIVIAIVAVFIILFVKATPEEAGCLPDNDPEVAALIHKEEAELKNVETLSYKDALKNPKVWVLGIGYGCFGLATLGIMSQLVDYFQTARGFGVNTAMYTVTIAAIIGMVGSWLWGVVDQKIGTKLTSVIFGFWYFVGIVFLILPSSFCMYIGIFMLGFAIGGNGNFPPSMASYVFGRRDFTVSYSCMNMVVGVVRSLSFVLLAVFRGRFEGYTIPYLLFASISIVGAILIAFVKVKGAVGSSLEQQSET